MNCQCVNRGPVDVVGLCDVSNVSFSLDSNPMDRNFTEVCIPEVFCLPNAKPSIETIDKVIIKPRIISQRLIKTPTGECNAEGTRLTGYKLIVEGVLDQTVIYTACVPEQTVHAAHFCMPFSTFIVMNALLIEELIFEDRLEYGFCIEVCIEDVMVRLLSPRHILKNVTLFLRAQPASPPSCG